MTEPLPESITRPLYMLWLAQTGPGMTATEIDFVGASMLPLERDWDSQGLRGVSTSFVDRIYPIVGPSPSDYLKSTGFIAPIENKRFRITEQGAALLKGAMRKSVEANAVFKLEPEAPLDYIGLLSELDTLSNPIVVDPYFHPHDFALLVDALPGVTLLTVDREVSGVDSFDKPKLNASLKRGQFEEELRRQTAKNSSCTVVYVPAAVIHDRYFLGSNRQGYFAGGSFRSSKPTVVMELDADHAGELYTRHQGIMNGSGATPLQPRDALSATTDAAT